MTSTRHAAKESSRLDFVRLDQIKVLARRRTAKDHRVEVLKQDMGFQGQLVPILLVERVDGFQLVDGLQRLDAARALGWSGIEAKILSLETTGPEIAFAEIMANIDREELTKLERAEYLADLYEIWQQLNPSARHGGDRRSAAVRLVKDREAENNDQGAILALCSEVAEKAGLSRRSFFRAIKVACDLSPDTKARLRGTWLEDHQAGLMLLAEQDAEMQAKVCDLLFADPPKAGNVLDAITLAKGGRLDPQADKLYIRTLSNIQRMPLSYKREIVRNLKSVVIDLAKEEGWLE